MDEASPGLASYERFTQWLKQGGFAPSSWKLDIAHSHSLDADDGTPAETAVEGQAGERGIRATADLVLSPPSRLLLSIPSALLITPERVRASSTVLAALPAASLERLTEAQLLVVFLIVHRRLGEQSPAFPYISLLPTSYAGVEWWTEEEVALLPRPPGSAHCDRAVVSEEDDPVLYFREQCARIRSECAALNALLSSRHPSLGRCTYDQDGEDGASDPGRRLSLRTGHDAMPPTDHSLCSCSSPPLSHFRCLVSLSEYQWAHSTVASRSCFWPGPAAAAAGSCCLIPFLDMLNHHSFVSATSSYDASTRQYHLSLRDRHPQSDGEDGDGTVRVPSSSQVFISYGELSNWQLLTRYGFVLADNQDERVALSVEDIEAFVARHCRRARRRGPHSVLARPATSSPTIAPPCTSAAPALSSIRCCCTRVLLPSSLTTQPPPGSFPALPVLPPFSSKHSALLALCRLYAVPSSFPVMCCEPHWPLLLYIKARTAFVGPDGGVGATTAEMASIASSMTDAQWIDREHERRGRTLLIALARWMEARLGEDRRSLQEQVADLEALTAEGKVPGGAAVDGEVSARVRSLCEQFRISRRRMLLGVIHHQEQALARMQ